MTLVPAYGRDYKSASAVKADFNTDQDFLVADYSSPWDGKPVNRADLVTKDIRRVTIRYKQLRNVVVVNV